MSQIDDFKVINNSTVHWNMFSDMPQKVSAFSLAPPCTELRGAKEWPVVTSICLSSHTSDVLNVPCIYDWMNTYTYIHIHL